MVDWWFFGVKKIWRAKSGLLDNHLKVEIYLSNHPHNFEHSRRISTIFLFKKINKINTKNLICTSLTWVLGEYKESSFIIFRNCDSSTSSHRQFQFEPCFLRLNHHLQPSKANGVSKCRARRKDNWSRNLRTKLFYLW